MRLYLLLIFVLVIPVGLAEFCGDYSDCSAKDCIGYSRTCDRGECQYSDCFVNYGEESVPSFQSALDDYKVETENTFGLKPILLLAGKVTIITIVVLILFLLFTVVRTGGALKLVVIFLMLLIVSASVVLLFGLHSKVMGMLGMQQEAEGYEGKIVKTAKKYDLSMEERDVSAKLTSLLGRGVVSGTEYRLYDENNEFSILLVEHAQGYSIRDAIPEKISEYNSKNGVYTSSANKNRQYIWEDNKNFYFVSGRSGSSVLNDLVQEQSKTKIFDFKPGNESYTNEKKVGFKVSGKTDVDIGVIEPDSMDICRYSGELMVCEFRSSGIEDGWNWVKIKAGGTGTMYNIYYDKTSPEITAEFENKSILSFFNAEFVIKDEGGVEQDSMKLRSPARLEFNCEKQNEQFMCSISGVPPEGKVPFKIIARDKAGNKNILSLVLYYDTTRPVLESTGDGFRVYDDYGVEKVVVDGEDYELDECTETSNGYECSASFSRVEVTDKAGNEAVLTS